MGKQIVMDHTGHTEHVFDKADKVSIEGAMARFEALRKEGHVAFRKFKEPRPGGATGEVIRAFDPDAEETLFRPALKGG